MLVIHHENKSGQKYLDNLKQSFKSAFKFVNEFTLKRRIIQALLVLECFFGKMVPGSLAFCERNGMGV
jgi:hypothetical protein